MNDVVKKILDNGIEDVTSQPSWMSPQMLRGNTGYTNQQATDFNPWNTNGKAFQMPSFSELNLNPNGLEDLTRFDSMFKKNAASSAASTFQPQGGIKNWMFGEYNPETGTTSPAYGMQTLGAALGLGQSFLGYKQYKLGKKAFKRSVMESDRNYNAQKQTINTAMQDRARANYSANPDFYQSPEQYMNENRIK